MNHSSQNLSARGGGISKYFVLELHLIYLILAELMAHWQSIAKSLDNNLKTMKANHVPAFLIRKVFTQIFSFINVQLFNSLLLRRECCSFSNAEYVKAGLAELEQWCCYATEEYVGSAWGEKHIRQAVGFLDSKCTNIQFLSPRVKA